MNELETALIHADLAHAALIRAGAFDLDLASASHASALIDSLRDEIARDVLAI